MRLHLLIIFTFTLFYYCILCIFATKLIELEPVTKSLETNTIDQDDSCTEFEDYFVDNCPIQRGDYNGCCLCTQYYYYGCDCCKELVDEIGVMGDCSKWGEPTGHDEFCQMKKTEDKIIDKIQTQ